MLNSFINFQKETLNSDAQSIVSGIQKIAGTLWSFFDQIGSAIAVIAVVCVFIKMIVCNDSKTVAECKKQMIIIAIAIIGIKFAEPLVDLVTSIGDNAATGAVIVENIKNVL